MVARAASAAESHRILIDAGVERIRLRSYADDGHLLISHSLSSNGDLASSLGALEELQGIEQPGAPRLFICGKLAEVVRETLGVGEVVLSAAVLWSALQAETAKERSGRNYALIDLSASGYYLVGVDTEGRLRSDLLVVNPRCGAGSGVNIDRVLQKLAIERVDVDRILAKYLGDQGKEAREKLNIRADRCGVFSSSATISDKNQGIPLDFALATTLKSEVLKTCKKLTDGFEVVYLTGGVFAWQFCRDCAEDYLAEHGVSEVRYDTEQSLVFDGFQNLIEKVGDDNFLRAEQRLKKSSRPTQYPPFKPLMADYEQRHLYKRLPDYELPAYSVDKLRERPLLLGLDVGSTMAKLVIADAQSREVLFLDAYSNSGDTIDTIKAIFRDLQSRGVEELKIAQVGITGSARYQVQEALRQNYPQLEERVSVLVENYAHARGSINYARDHIQHLIACGHEQVNKDFFVLVDIGGEDTKISTISLHKGDLYDNAMNVKCSAGTGSLMDSLRALFGIDSVGAASKRAFNAERAFVINATCAVFLMENARKLQAEGYRQDEILASANWAIVENMARTLWDQLALPAHSVVMLHGQTMLSDPLPLAVTHRLQEFVGDDCYGLVPPYPGHMACLGLINSLPVESVEESPSCHLQEFIDRQLSKKIIVCKGAACGDKDARCNRTSLSGRDDDGKKFHFTLGGCTAINEVMVKKPKRGGVSAKTDSYRELWQAVNQALPHSDAPDRLIIPRSFVVSEWAYLLANIFTQLGIPVEVDNVKESDPVVGQPLFATDTCAPQLGIVGQLQRLAATAHGTILLPQIEDLPTNGKGVGRTCTINQGGLVVAQSMAESRYPEAHFSLFTLKLDRLEPLAIASQLQRQLGELFGRYQLQPSLSHLTEAVDAALQNFSYFRRQLADRAADMIETALAEGQQVALIVGREYILNPGVYDSHVGRLLRDKNLLAIPAYLLATELDESFKHIYWRNPQLIVTILKAVADKRLHERLLHPRLKALFKRIETKSCTLLPVVQVSTFRCGPDSAIEPLVAEIMKKRPFLLIQSDAVIKELAHLENRVNTYVKQLELDLQGDLSLAEDNDFEIAFLDELTDQHGLDRERDVLYFPTMADNRFLTSVVRAAGYTCVDNYHEGEYDLSELVKEGQKYTGDSLCAPIAAVYGDLLRAVEDFKQRKAAGDPAFVNKRRVLYFDNKGQGPCRQGQYPDLHKLFAFQSRLGRDEPSMATAERSRSETFFKLLIADETNNFNIGLEEWVMLRGFQGVILQGILQTLLFKGGANCRDYGEYQRFLEAYRALKQQIFAIQEQKLKPLPAVQPLLKLAGSLPYLGSGLKYFGYRLYSQELQQALSAFVQQWLLQPLPGRKRLNIHIDGEVYMRASQAESIFTTLLSSIGFQRFELDCTPVWSYLLYMVQEGAMMGQDRLAVIRDQLVKAKGEQRQQLGCEIRQIESRLLKGESLSALLREHLAKPLYKAAGLEMPEGMAEVLQSAKQVMPTLRPYGELAPYVGEALEKLRGDCDLLLNIAPEGCMVSSMGDSMSGKILQQVNGAGGQIKSLFTSDGQVDEEQLTVALLKSLGPMEYYRAAQ